MKHMKVDPRKIKVPEVRVTSQFDADTRAQFEAAVKEWGIETPILCFEVNGDLVLVDGKNRLDEALTLGLPQVDVVTREGDMVQVLTRNIYLDHLRGKHNVTDMIRVLRSLSEDYGLDPDQIAEQTYKNRDYVERLLKISQASPAVLESLDQGIIGVGHAYELSRLPYAVQQEEVIAKTQIYRLKVHDLKELVDNTLVEMQNIQSQPAPAADIEHRPPPVYHCEGCQDEIEPRYLRPVMVCPDCFGEIWRLGKLRRAQQGEVKVEEEGD